jgi:hypothetical protein
MVACLSEPVVTCLRSLAPELPQRQLCEAYIYSETLLTVVTTVLHEIISRFMLLHDTVTNISFDWYCSCLHCSVISLCRVEKAY